MKYFFTAATAIIFALLFSPPIFAGVETDSQRPIEIHSARFHRESEPNAAQSVSLPHVWQKSHQAREGVGRYVFEVDLPYRPTRPWAIYAPRISSHHQVWVNGECVHDTLTSSSPSARPVPVPGWVDVPSSLLHQGANQFELKTSYGSRAGLSSVLVGDADQLRDSFESDLAWGIQLPQALNICAAGLSIFLVLIWVRRPAEKALGYFGLLWVMVSLRNLAYYTTGSIGHPAFRDYGFFSAQVLSFWLLGLFGLAWSTANWGLYRRILNSVAIVLLLTGAVAAYINALIGIRYVVYPMMLLASMPAVYLIAKGARRQRVFVQVCMLMGIGFTLVAAMHDYLALSSRLSVMSAYWLPFCTPITLVAVTMSLMDRFVDGLNAVERQNSNLELAVSERTRELARAHAEKTRFIAAASHDLRQPIAAMSLLASLLSDQVKDSGLRQITDKLVDASKSLEMLVKGLLDLARFEAGAITNRPQPVSVYEIVKRVFSHEQGEANRKGLILRHHVLQDCYVMADPVLLEQVIRNLIGNAVRYTANGGVLVAARLRIPHLRIEVWDTGKGIPNHQVEGIFNEFFQIEPNASEKGLGLGLALVRHAAAIMNAPLDVKSVVGRGSRFSITLESVQPILRVISEENAKLSKIWKDLDVVIVENDQRLRSALLDRLMLWGARPQSFDCMRSAKQEMLKRSQCPDVLICDFQLDDGFGTVVIREWREHFNGKDFVALIMTGETEMDVLALIRNEGLDVLLKPFNSDDLTRLVVEIISRKS